MRNEVAKRWLGSRWFAALLFAALFSRALVPVGYMPGPGGLVLCSGYAPVLAPSHSPGIAGDMSGMSMPDMDMSGNTDPSAGGPGSRHAIEFCPYTAVAGIMAAGHAPLLTTFALFIPSVTVFPPQESIPRGTIVPTSLPRGPPTVA